MFQHLHDVVSINTGHVEETNVEVDVQADVRVGGAEEMIVATPLTRQHQLRCHAGMALHRHFKRTKPSADASKINCNLEAIHTIPQKLSGLAFTYKSEHHYRILLDMAKGQSRITTVPI